MKVDLGTLPRPMSLLAWVSAWTYRGLRSNPTPFTASFSGFNVISPIPVPDTAHAALFCFTDAKEYHCNM